MTDHLAVTRTAELDLSPEELWALVSDGRRWSEWMVDASDVDVVPGGRGVVVDDGTERDVRVRTVVDGHLVFEWRPLAGDDDTATSVVEIEVTPLDGGTGSRLRVVETFASVARATSAELVWDVRLLVMCTCVAVCCRA